MLLSQVLFSIYIHPQKFCTYSSFTPSSVSIATGYRLNGPDSIPLGARDFPLVPTVQTGTGSHPASYPLGTRDSFHGDKSARE
jgi:hypothetical protein